MRAKLFVRSANVEAAYTTNPEGFVAEVQMPDFNPPPIGLVWGSRTFFIRGVPSLEQDASGVFMRYVEDMLWVDPTHSDNTSLNWGLPYFAALQLTADLLDLGRAEEATDAAHAGLQDKRPVTLAAPKTERLMSTTPEAHAFVDGYTPMPGGATYCHECHALPEAPWHTK